MTSLDALDNALRLECLADWRMAEAHEAMEAGDGERFDKLVGLAAVRYARADEMREIAASDRYPDPDGNYEPGNCRWATASEQEENKIGKRRLTLGGRTLTVHEWARQTGLPLKEITRRILRGWPVEKVLSQSMRKSPRHG